MDRRLHSFKVEPLGAGDAGLRLSVIPESAVRRAWRRSFGQWFHAMRLIGFSMLLSGFLWIAWDCAEGFTQYQHALWILQTQHLPAGESIQRTDAAGAMRELSLNLKNRHREIFLPAAVMLVGGLLLGFKPGVIAERDDPPNGGPAMRSGNSDVGGGLPSVS